MPDWSQATGAHQTVNSLPANQSGFGWTEFAKTFISTAGGVASSVWGKNPENVNNYQAGTKSVNWVGIGVAFALIAVVGLLIYKAVKK